jgi:hypothetical protein
MRMRKVVRGATCGKSRLSEADWLVLYCTPLPCPVGRFDFSVARGLGT